MSKLASSFLYISIHTTLFKLITSYWNVASSLAHRVWLHVATEYQSVNNSIVLSNFKLRFRFNKLIVSRATFNSNSNFMNEQKNFTREVFTRRSIGNFSIGIIVYNDNSVSTTSHRRQLDKNTTNKS